MSGTYDSGGIRFFYPENWQITDEETLQWPHTVTAQSPRSGFWTLTVYNDDIDSEELLQTALDAMSGDYADLEVDGASECLEEVEMIGYDLNFYCLDLVITTRLRSFRCGGQTILLICQGENRDFDQLELVFSAITISFLRAAKETE